jgi:hypothetical protein
MNSIESAKAKALLVVEMFPEAKTVQEAYDLAVNANMFANKNESLATWGRLLRLLPQQVA